MLFLKKHCIINDSYKNGLISFKYLTSINREIQNPAYLDYILAYNDLGVISFPQLASQGKEEIKLKRL